MAVPWLWRLVAELLSSKARLRSHFSLCEICGGLSDTEQFFSDYLGFTLSIVIPPMLHTHLNLRVVLTRRMNRRSLGTFQQAVLFRKSGNIG